MRRREFLSFLGGAAAAWPIMAQAQPADRIRRVAVLMGFPEGDPSAQTYVASMQQKLSALGWGENRNIQIIRRWAGGDPEKTRAMAKELIGMSPSVIVTSTNQATEIMRQETKAIPIVFASLGDPVGSGLVASMNRPGGNVTGFPAFVESMGGKWLELLTEVAPRATRIGFIHHPGVAPHRGLVRAAQAAAQPLKIDLIPLPIHNADEITAAITTFASGGHGGLVTASHAVTFSNRDLLIRLATQHRLPSLFGEPIFAESGALLSYGSDQTEMFLGAASYVDQILKGSKPAEMPVQLPTKFNFIINLKAAETIGLTVPPAMLARADRVIE
jgi:putative tryptophan/tyrosine transport system substrate-binding protein